MVRSPGYCPPPNFTVQDVTVDAYISPRETLLGSAGIQEKVALLIQQFGEGIVLPHLRRFTSRCQMEGIPAVKVPR